MTENLEVSGRRDGARDASDHDAWLAELRRRALAHARAKPPSWSRGLKVGAMAMALLAHLLFGIWLARLMHQPPAKEDDAIRVDLIAGAAPEPELPEPPAAGHAQGHAVIVAPRPAPHRDDAMSAAIDAPAGSTPFSSAALFNADGKVRLPGTRPTPHERGMERGRELMRRGHNLLRCSRGRLQAYVSPEEAATAAATHRAAYLALFHSPADDPMLKGLAAPQESAAAGDAAAERARIEAEACDDDVWQRPLPLPGGKPALPAEETH